jgi:hypothetical protein
MTVRSRVLGEFTPVLVESPPKGNEVAWIEHH